VKREIILTKKQHMTRLLKALTNTQRQACFNLLEKLLTNIIDCKDPALQEKRRSIKQSNTLLKAAITATTQGTALLEQVGFVLVKNKGEPTY